MAEESGTSASAARTPHIVLVGLPGAGKTSVGRQLARRLERAFLDFDTELEHREHATIPQIFATKGEDYFRGLERTLSAELAASSGMVLSAGGGWAANAGAVALLREVSRIIYLRVSPEAALVRIAATRGRRPLLEVPDPAAAMARLYDLRRASYESADWVLDTENLDKQGVIEQVREYVIGTG